MIVFPPNPILVITPLGTGFVVYIKSTGMWENDEVCVALTDGGQWRHFTTGQIKAHENGPYQIKKEQL